MPLKEPCQIRCLTAKSSFWDFVISDQEEFDFFVSQLREAWRDAQTDAMCLKISVHQVDLEDTGVYAGSGSG